MAYWYFLMAGAMAGLCAGLFGVGGGLVIVPILLIVFAQLGYPTEILAHMAVGTSLATIVITSISSMQSHHRYGNVRWDIVKYMTGGLMVGSLIGAYVASFLASQLLTALIAMMAMAMGSKMLIAKAHNSYAQKVLPSVGVQSSIGFLIGMLSAIFGIGGGSLTVPFLARFIDIKHAVGTSAACGLPIAAAGAAGFMLFGQQQNHLPAGAIGFVHVGAFLCIAVMSFIFAKVGAKLAHSLPNATLKRLFGGLLVVVGIKMMVGVIG